MSYTLDNRIKTVHVIDPRVDVNAIERHQYGVLSSGNENNFRQYPLNGINDSNISWSGVNPPSEKTYVNRRGYKTMTWQLTFVGTSGGAGQTLLQCPGLQPGVAGNNAYYDAPRAYPLANVVQVESVSINGTNFTQNNGLYYASLARYHNDPDNEDHEQSMTPSMCDQFQAYSQGFGFARDPLRGYGDNPLQCPRGGFVGCTVLRNDSTGSPGDTAIVQLTATEPLYVSPWLFGKHEEECAFIGIRTIDINMLLGGRGTASNSGVVGSLWSHNSSSPSTFSSTSAHLISASVLFNYINPDLSQQLPKQVNYNYYNPNYQQTVSQVSIAPGVNQQFMSNNLVLSNIPNRAYVWVGPNDALYNFASSDCYYGITQVQIQFENRPVIMSQATQQDLYQMSVRNGCNLSWRQWTQDVGSVLCVNFGNDFALTPLQSPGLRGNFNFQITVNATNLHPTATFSSSSLNVLFISEGLATISNGTCIQTLGVLNQEDVLQAKQEMPVRYKPGENVYGGAISWSGVLDFLKRATRGALNVGKAVIPSLAPQYAPALGIADAAASALGVGRPYGGAPLGRSKMMKLLH